MNILFQQFSRLWKKECVCLHSCVKNRCLNQGRSTHPASVNAEACANRLDSKFVGHENVFANPYPGHLLRSHHSCCWHKCRQRACTSSSISQPRISIQTAVVQKLSDENASSSSGIHSPPIETQPPTIGDLQTDCRLNIDRSSRRQVSLGVLHQLRLLQRLQCVLMAPSCLNMIYRLSNLWLLWTIFFLLLFFWWLLVLYLHL
jgi:hypothetical protein